ncbi:SET domain-containing protein SmydA-8-like isoform X2 [Homarus americanus]|uniref:SET domain-containing protein SmydA-8-like isoform X2 n=1 Tax=Homarus americanus TaxID=6706 RepID=UPI001C48A71A|nr:SET domain-containing protein SmydA-8-like isoform X2 [Homarus americanus]
MVLKKACEVCGGEATVSCSVCYGSHYCSSEHLRHHWEDHRRCCHPVIEQTDPAAGRFLATSRDVQAGELLLKESPIAVGPRATSPLVCLGCHELIPGTEFPRCPSCWWPLCSSDCVTSSLHQAECPILAVDTKRVGQPIAAGSTPRYDIILVLRCLLLRRKDPPAWGRLLDMASHAQRRLQNKDQHHMATVRYIKEILKVDYSVEEINHARGAIITNCFEWRSSSGVSLRGVYPQLARMNHSCRPTVTMNCDCEGTMSVLAAADMQRGDQLFNTYTGTTQPLWERRAYTSEVHFFTCDCVRCSDPTELGLHYSSPRCEKCMQQYLEATTWLGEMKWECPVCGERKPELDIRQEVEQWLGRFESDDTFLHATPYAVKSILDKVEEAFHSQHHVWVLAAHVAIRTLQKNTSRAGLILKRNLWRKLLHIYDTLEPGLTKRRAPRSVTAADGELTKVPGDAVPAGRRRSRSGQG